VKRTLLIMIAVLLLVSCRKSGVDEKPKLYAVSAEGKIGFVNNKGEFLIEPRFGRAMPFSEVLPRYRWAQSGAILMSRAMR
jgi:hypothetical protein